MGGGGEYYRRDTEDGYKTNERGHSTAATELMGRKSVDPGVLPRGRRVRSRARSPMALIYDVSGSPEHLPLIFIDKFPLIAGQIVKSGYLTDPEVSMAAVGDLKDEAPIQIGDFTKVTDADDWLRRLWREKGGYNNNVEGYELTAYYYAYCCDIPNAETPFCVFVADEGMRRRVYQSDLERHLGGTHESVDTQQVFRDLDTKFNGNVFLLHRFYRDADHDETALTVWRECLGNDRIIRIGPANGGDLNRYDRAIADITLGLFALVNRVRTLDEYLEDMRTARDVPQTKQRIDDVRAALAPLAAFLQSLPSGDASEREPAVARTADDLPSPDEVNERLDTERDRGTTRFLDELRSVLLSPSRTPKPAKDGWGYCTEPALPEHVTKDSPDWERVRARLAKAGWTADIAPVGESTPRMLCIRRA